VCAAAQEAVVWCATCGNNVHAECFRLWSAQRARQGADPVCVFCRSPWGGAEAAADKPAARAQPRGRVNLMDVSQVRGSGAPSPAPACKGGHD
jgi:hypothetical protein